MMVEAKRIILFSPMAWEPDEPDIGKSSTKRVGVPLSVLSVASGLNMDKYDVRVISGAEAEYIEKVRSVLSNGTICFGISSMTGYQITQGIEIAKIVRSYNKDIPIVWGGFHPSIFPEQTAKSEYVDYVVRGYGEFTFSDLIRAFEKEVSLDTVNGITYWDGGNIISAPDRQIKEINSLPPVPYDLVDVPSFLTTELGDRTLGYLSSRGCPSDCKFCADTVVYKRRWKALSAERVLSDISLFKKKYNIDSVRYFDSNYFVHEKRVKEICKGMIDRKLNLRWGRVNGSAEFLVRYDSETWELMKESGCYSLLVGAESGYRGALKKVNKRATIEDILKLSELTNKYGIRVIYSFMLGVPLDISDYDRQREEFRQELAGTLSLINELLENTDQLDRIILFRFTLYPGNSLYDECTENGWKAPGSLEEWCDNTLWKAKLPWLTDEESDTINSIIKLVQRSTPFHKMDNHKSVSLRILNKVKSLLSLRN
ncbi:MAG TPA: radical SAM protein [Nitrospirae bacterium]|nr:radical SAM protein [Nitrospirota bacterium]